MEEIFWKTMFLILFCIWLSIRLIFALISLKSKVKIKKSNLIERFLVFLNKIGMGGLAVFVVFNNSLDFAQMNLPQEFRWLALISYSSNIGLFVWCHKSLGTNFSAFLEIRKSHRLVQDGPYKKIRHPMYTHFWILVICQGILLNNWIILIYGMLAWGLLYFYRVQKEEAMMIQEFGKTYIRYMKTTGRLFPKFK